MDLKLKLHLIPSGSFYSNLRNQLTQNEWSRISKMVRGYHGKCQFCGWKPSIFRKEYTHLHEVWNFENGIQQLVDFECVCPTCHYVHHWGKSQIDGLNMDFLLRHACKVNKCSEEIFKQHIEDSFWEWQMRSQCEWNLKTDHLESILEKNKVKI